MDHGYRYAPVVLLALLVGCASNVAQTAVAQAGPSRPVDAAEDNRAALAQLTPGLVMRLEIDGKTVQMHDPELVLVPRRAAARRAEGERVVVTGWRGQEQVAAVSVPDQRINVEEGGGIVLRDQRSLNVALPTSRRLDRIEVTLPGATPQTFSVAEVFDQACAQNRGSDFCR